MFIPRTEGQSLPLHHEFLTWRPLGPLPGNPSRGLLSQRENFHYALKAVSSMPVSVMKPISKVLEGLQKKKKKKYSISWLPARRGRGTPPTKMVLRGSRGWEPSMTKSLSLRFQGRIWTCGKEEGKIWSSCVLLHEFSVCWKCGSLEDNHRKYWPQDPPPEKKPSKNNDIPINLICTSFSFAAHRFVFDGGTGDTQVELAILLDAGVDQSLNRGLFLEEQEGVAWKEDRQIDLPYWSQAG